MPYKAPWDLEGRTAMLPAPVGALRAAAAASDARDDFIALSVALTGFEEVELLGTGAADFYLPWLDQHFADVLGELLAAWHEAEVAPDREAAVRAILADDTLGSFARSVVVLWYTATWTKLSDADWHKYRGTGENTNQVFGAAYPEGLVWKAANIHPTAAKPTGFGTWAFPPPA